MMLGLLEIWSPESLIPHPGGSWSPPGFEVSKMQSKSQEIILGPLEGTLNENVDVKYYILYYNSKITVHVGFLMYGHDQSVVHTVDA